MTIKTFAFEVQSNLSKAPGIALKRSHVHEVLAALFGFSSYAALTTQRVLVQHDDSAPAIPLDIARAAGRALDLGYASPAPPLIAAETARAAEAARLCVVTVDAVLFDLGIESGSDVPVGRADDASGLYDSNADKGWDARDADLTFAIDLESPFLRESLLRLADAGSASAHLALAQIDDEFFSEQSAGASDGIYWFEQQQSGRLLAGVELEWAEAYRRKQESLGLREQRFQKEQHLQRAVALGSAEAALRQLEKEPRVENFEVAACLAGAPQAARLGYLAMVFEREDDARKWFRVAAQHGDIDAMKMLASRIESDLKDAWTWVHLAKLHGVNVMAYHAVGDDGLPADADEAGPIYGAGGFELDQLSEKDNAEALEAARRIHAGLGGTA